MTFTVGFAGATPAVTTGVDAALRVWSYSIEPGVDDEITEGERIALSLPLSIDIQDPGGSSSTNIGVGKSAVSTNTTENYNLDTGWNFGMQASYAGTGGGFTAGETGQWGSVNRAGLENTNMRTAETSIERRELQSHVTQLAQMYNLFQAFHIGANRRCSSPNRDRTSPVQLPSAAPR